MSNKKILTEKNQQDRARLLFIILAVVFAVCFYFLLAVQYEYPPWYKFAERLAEQKLEPKKIEDIINSFEPLKWALASLIGATLYLMGQIATFFPKINEKPDPDNQNDFINSTYWYFSTLLRAPILTVVIMWLLTNLKVEIAGDTANSLGIAVNFSEFSSLVKIGAAFILGFYGRVARKQLDIIAEYLFTRAWALAQMGFEISVSSPDVILLKDTYTFKTEPMTDVVWTSNMGTMDADKGTYKALEDAGDHDKEVIIRAQLRSEPSVTQFKRIKLKLFKISGETAVKSGAGDITLKLETKFDDVKFDEAVWTVDGQKVSTKGKEYTWTVPTVNKGDADKKVKVSAAINYKDKEYLAETEITVKPKET